MEWNKQQQEVLDKVGRFLSTKGGGVFLLRGYAGTGKTTLAREFITMAEKAGRKTLLMTPTGRAAKVLADKTGRMAKTIHRHIYQLDKIEEDKTTGDLRYHFPLATLDDAGSCLAIVDEASMVAEKKDLNGRLNFGNNGLLPDLLDFMNVHYGGKIIFIGDPAQLPPVGESRSMALDDEYFKSKGIATFSAELTQVMRQADDSLVLHNATIIRNLLARERVTRNTLLLSRDNRSFAEIASDKIIDQYLRCRSGNPSDVVMICYTNRGAYNLNRLLRERLYGGLRELTAGDILISTANHYDRQSNVDVLNGEMLTVVWADDAVVTRTQYVAATVDGNKSTKPVTLSYRRATLRNDAGVTFEAMIIDTMLHDAEPQLTGDRLKSMYIDFKVRHSHLKEGSEEFIRALAYDPYFNALKLKYGYAITGHKSQGGEWDTALVDFTGRTGLDDDCLRWMYTAVTRARRRLAGASLPTITALSKMKVFPIQRITKPREKCRAYAPVGETPFHGADTPTFLRAKYFAVADNMSGTEFQINAVKSISYKEIYYIAAPDGVVRVDCNYGAAEVFTSHIPAEKRDYTDRLIALMADESSIEFQVDYVPSTPALATLFRHVASICSEYKIKISNIMEHPANYHVEYFVITSGRFAFLDFYFKANGAISSVMSKSDLGADDEKLKLIVERLENL